MVQIQRLKSRQLPGRQLLSFSDCCSKDGKQLHKDELLHNTGSGCFARHAAACVLHVHSSRSAFPSRQAVLQTELTMCNTYAHTA